ncbi:MAG: metabolite traffic protein EboE [Bacteroidota bacterium]
MLLKNNFHLSYCSNIHSGTNWEVTFDGLKNNLPKVKDAFSPDAPFGVGLRLSNLASEQLGVEEELDTFKSWLYENGFYVFTMNGFPYGNFHGQPVKDEVHAPDWTSLERLKYTLRLFDQLSVLLPEGVEGGISTSPVSYKHWHKGDAEVKKVLERGAANIAKAALRLFQIENETGKHMHLDLEPEPDGLLENTQEVLSFYRNYLVPAAVATFGQAGIFELEAEKLVKKYINICYDVCHFALAFEEPKHTFQQLANAGIKIGKIQISAALRIIQDNRNLQEIWDSLKAFDEPTYLHQVTEMVNGNVKTYSDLPEILSQQKDFAELRAHFHVPIFLAHFGLLYSTQDQIVATLEFLKQHPNLTKHLEIETYTWEVLPAAMKIPIVDSIVRELNWAKMHIQ